MDANNETTTTTTKERAVKAIPGKPCPECGCPYPGDHTLECRITPEVKVRRITDILEKYYWSGDETDIAPENIIEAIRAEIKL